MSLFATKSTQFLTVYGVIRVGASISAIWLLCLCRWLLLGCTICIMRAAEHSSVDDRDLNLRQIIDSAPALIHTARPDGYLDFFNQTWLDFVGQPLKSLLGWKWTSWIHPEEVESFVQKWRESIATGEC